MATMEFESSTGCDPNKVKEISNTKIPKNTEREIAIIGTIGDKASRVSGRTPILKAVQYCESLKMISDRTFEYCHPSFRVRSFTKRL